MKFNHKFILAEKSSSTYSFKSDNHNARIDFFEHMVRVALFRDGERIFPTFSVCPDGDMPEFGREKLSIQGLTTITPEITENGEYISFRTPDSTLDLSLQNLEMTWLLGSQVLFKDREYISYNFDHELGQGSTHYISREPDEEIFGLGDKTGNINKNGRSFRLGTSDALGFDAASSDPLYKHIPFYICRNSVGCYGLYYDTYSDGEFNFGREINNYYRPFKSFKCAEEPLVYYVIFGNDVPEVLTRFAKLRGRDLLPPLWTFRYCGSTMAYTDAPDADVQLRGFVEKCRSMGLKPGGFYMSSGYTQIGEKRYVFHWNTDKIPSPEGLSSYFRENGIEILPNIKPCLLSDHPLYSMIAQNGWFLQNSNGTPALFPFWGGMGSYLDFTNPEAAAFWTKCVKEQLVDKGFYSTWNDNNEYDINDEDVYAYGFGTPIKAKLIKPLFAFLMTRASVAAEPEEYGKNAVSRCGMVGTSRIASTWTGDNRTAFCDFRYNHKMAMTMSLSGIYNFGQDIGGFAGPKPDKELFLRWIQYGIFTPRFVLHSWNDDGSSNMPWLYEDEIPTVKKLFDLRERLLPYLHSQVERSVMDYTPIIYPIFLKYPNYDVESDAFFFGDDIIACPVFDEGATSVTVTLPDTPEGWYFKGMRYEGTVTLPCTIHDLPVFFTRGNNLI